MTRLGGTRFFLLSKPRVEEQLASRRNQSYLVILPSQTPYAHVCVSQGDTLLQWCTRDAFGRRKYSLGQFSRIRGLVLLTLWRGERFRCKVYAPARESVYQTVQTGRSACQMQRRDVFLSARQLQTSWHRYRARSVYPSKGQSRAARTLIFPRRPDGSIDLGVRLRALLVVSQARQDHTIV